MNDADILVWPDGTWCYRRELARMASMPDDYRVIYVETEEYDQFDRW